jgi:hypothetical protein
VTTTGTNPRTRTREEPSGQRLAALAAMLDRAGLELRVTPDEAVDALAAAFAKHPPGTRAGALIGAALTPAPGRERDRPAEQRAVRRLLASGQAPHPRAVDMALDHERWHQARRDRLDQLAERDAVRAADVVIDYWRKRGRAPSIAYLGRVMGWGRDTAPVVRRLAALGWLVLDGDQTPQPGRRGAGVAP